MKKDIWVKILTDKRDALYEIPNFIPTKCYDELEQSIYSGMELGKIETHSYNFRFAFEHFRIESDQM